MKVGLKSGVNLETGEVVDAEQAFINNYFRTAELIRQTKETLKGYKNDLDAIYLAYRKYQDEKRQGKLFQ